MDYKKHIAGLKNGSYNDFMILYDEYYGRLFGFVLQLVKSRALAQDIVQETFLRVWINRATIQPQLSFKSYLFKISNNLIIDGFRKQLNNPVVENYLEYCHEVKLDQQVDSKIDFDLFVKELGKAKLFLSPRQKEIFELSKECGLDTTEIAKQLCISEQTVYNTLSSAIGILRKKIDKNFLLQFLLVFLH